MHSQLLSCVLAAVLTSGVLGCSSEDATLGREQQSVLDGEPTGARHDNVLYVAAEVRNVSGLRVVKIGSGSLVAPNLVLTALHVVSQNPSDVPFSCDTRGNATSGSSGASLGAAVMPSKVSVYAGPEPGDTPLGYGTRIVSTGSTTICENDLAFVVLDRPLELPTYRVHRGPAVTLGDALTVVGYGATLDLPGAQAQRTERSVDVTAVGQWIRTFTVSEGPCEGDSGGPALSASGELVGVFSSVSLDCRGPNANAKYTDLSYFERLVEDAFAAADAGSPWSESGDGGAGGAGGVEVPAGGAAVSTPAHVEPKESGCAITRGAAPERSFALLCVVLLGLLRRRLHKERTKLRDSRKMGLKDSRGAPFSRT